MAWTTPRTWEAEETITAALLNTHVRDNLSYLKNNIGMGTASLLTISSGAVTKSQAFHKVAVESGSTDDLDTISGGSEGDVIFLAAADGDETIVVKNGTGNIILAADISLDSLNKVLPLMYYNSYWQQFRVPLSDLSYCAYGVWGRVCWGRFIWA